MPRKGRRNLQPHEKDEIVAIYQTTSKSMSAIAKRFDVCGETVSRLLRQRGIATRDRVDTGWTRADSTRETRRLNPYEKEDIVSIYQTTSTPVTAIAEKFGVYRTTIHDLLKSLGIASRKHARVNECPACAESTRKSGKPRGQLCDKHLNARGAEYDARYRERWYPGAFYDIKTKAKKYLGWFDSWIGGLSGLPALTISLRSNPRKTGADLYFQADSFGVRWSCYQVGHFTYETIHEMVGRLLLLLEDYRRIDRLNTATERIAA